jgi:hypothetical protein
MNSILPDSRLKEKKGSIRVDWQTRNVYTGQLETIRLSLEPIYCISCGKSAGMVPEDIISWCSWLCDKCSDQWGNQASLHKCPDSVFWQRVKEEMLERYGRELTQAELNYLADQNKLSIGLQLLERESPYKQMVS